MLPGCASSDVPQSSLYAHLWKATAAARGLLLNTRSNRAGKLSLGCLSSRNSSLAQAVMYLYSCLCMNMQCAWWAT